MTSEVLSIWMVYRTVVIVISLSKRSCFPPGKAVCQGIKWASRAGQ